MYKSVLNPIYFGSINCAMYTLILAIYHSHSYPL